MNEKYEMAVTLARTYAWNAKILKASGSEGWKQSLETAKKMLELARVELKMTDFANNLNVEIVEQEPTLVNIAS